jgi:hypothetical protein
MILEYHRTLKQTIYSTRTAQKCFMILEYHRTLKQTMYSTRIAKNVSWFLNTIVPWNRRRARRAGCRWWEPRITP